MANLTKTQLIKRTQELREKLDDLFSQLDDLMCEAEDERDSIEPYDGKDDLTPAQEERQEWFESACDSLDSARNSVEDALSSLDEVE